MEHIHLESEGRLLRDNECIGTVSLWEFRTEISIKYQHIEEVDGRSVELVNIAGHPPS